MSLLRKGIFASGGSVFCAGLGIVSSMMLARALQPEGMGQYKLPFTVGTLIVTFLGLGIGQANIYLLNKHKIDPRQIMINSIWISLVGAIVIILILPIVLTTFMDYFGRFPLLVIILFSLGISFSYGVNLFRPMLVAALRIQQAVIADVAGKAIFLLAVALGFLFNWLTVNVALFLVALEHLFCILLVIWFLRGQITFGYSFNSKVFKDGFSYGLRLLLSNIVTVMNASIGLLLLRYLMPDDFANIGYYDRATSLCGLIMLVPVAVGPLLYANWSGLSGQKRNSQAAMAMRLYLVLGLVIVFGIALFARWAMLLLFGQEFLPAVPALRILAVGIALRCTFAVCNNLLASDGRAHVTAYIMSVSVVIMIVLTCLLVPYYGINGAALAFVFAGFSVFVIGIVLMKYSYGIKFKSMLLLRKSDFTYALNAIRNKTVVATDREPETNV